MPLLYGEAYIAMYTKSKKKANTVWENQTTSVVIMNIVLAFVGLDRAKSQQYHSEIADPKKCSTFSHSEWSKK